MKFEYITPKEGEHRIYDGKTAKAGDVVEYVGFFADKAMNNPDFRLITESAPVVTKKKTTKKKTTKKKVKRGD